MKGLPLQLQVATQSTGADVNADEPYSAIVRCPFLTISFLLRFLADNLAVRVREIGPPNSGALLNER
jgi:hypothetical protein